VNRYELAVHEVRSVLAEWDPRPLDDIIATKIVERLVAKGVIQSTDPEELGYRTGPLEPGRTIVGGRVQSPTEAQEANRQGRLEQAQRATQDRPTLTKRTGNPAGPVVKP